MAEDFNKGYWFISAPGGSGKTHALIKQIKQRAKQNQAGLCVTFTRGAADEIKLRLTEDKKDRVDISKLDEYGLEIGTLHSICKRLLDNYWSSTDKSNGPNPSRYRILSQNEEDKLISKAFYNVMKRKYPRFPQRELFIEHPLSWICAKGQRKKVEDLYYEATSRVYHTIIQTEIEDVTLLLTKRFEDIQLKSVEITDESQIILLYPEYRKDSVPDIKRVDWPLIIDSAYELMRLKQNNDNGVITYACDFDDLLCMMWNFLQHHSRELNQYDWVRVDEAQDLSKLQLEVIRKLTAPAANVVYFGDANQAIFSFMSGKDDIIKDIRNEVEEVKGGKTYSFYKNYRSSPKLIQYQLHYIRKNLILGKDEKKKFILQPTIRSPKDINGQPSVEIINYSTEDQQNREAGRLAIKLTKDNPDKTIAILCRTNKECKHIEEVIRYWNREDKSGIEGRIYNMSGERNTFALNKDTRTLFYNLRQKLVETKDFKVSEEILNLEGEGECPIVELFREYTEILENRYKLSCEEFIEELSSRTIADAYGCVHMKGQHKKGGLIISTVHRAKGKAYDIVIVPSVVEGNYPLKTSTKKAQIQEDARLLYVAISRAREKLILTTYDKGTLLLKPSQKKYKQRSEDKSTDKGSSSERKRINAKHIRVKVTVKSRMIVDEQKEIKISRFVVNPRGTVCYQKT